MRPELAPMADGRDEWRRGWPVLCAGMIGLGTGSGLYQNISSLFMPGMMAEFGWSRGDISTAGGLGLVGGFAAPFVGRLADRVGVRAVIIGSMLLIGLADVGLSRISGGGLWHYQLFVICLALAASGTNALVYGKLIARAFVRHRGMALGIVTSGISLSTIAVPPVLGIIISARGWRAGMVSLAILVVMVALPLVLLAIRHVPSSRSERADAETHARSSAGVGGSEARRTGTFWRLAVSVMLINMATIGLVSQLVPFGIDHGLSPARAALLLASYGVSQISGRIVIGPLIDRIGVQTVAACAAVVSALGFVLLALPTPGFAMLMTAVFVAGVMNGAEHDILPFFVTREFGLIAYGEIYGTLLMLSLFGTAAGTIGFGRLHDATGGYGLALALGAVGLLCAALAFATLRDRPLRPGTGADSTPLRSPSGVDQPSPRSSAPVGSPR